ncbi:hypothetical protein EJ08DRAFT_308806 [Tothia fuscella]|uniref:Tubulin-specific chaperone D C-terminal domain-containing protein n=1 Tax=Tothia fuscella TaxID=1048955 RepID=A0A9P4NNW1_9PEZI|nr:hypothetical protein EJ08DRAFT_308806 [Tothia fuscella]
MASTEDDDVWLLRASADMVAGVNTLLKRLLWKRPSKDTEEVRVHRVVKERELDKLILLIEPFQEDPQLLDSQLNRIIPQLVTAYLESLKNHTATALKPGQATVRHAICRVLYTFCKVRGEKIIVGFLNNEPRYVEPLLAVFERGTKEIDEGAEEAGSHSISWEERFILLLWLSHLMLAPFHLSTISSFEPARSADQYDNLKLPTDLPGIPLRIIPICFRYLQAATKERTAAAQLLVRLCLRPDMRKIGLLDAVTEWALFYFQVTSDENDIHRSLGTLGVLSGILASGNQEEIGHFIAPIFRVSQQLMTDDKHAIVRSSAVARKLLVKMLRNIVVHCLKAPSDDIDTTEVLEEVIGQFLELLEDGDTPVRYAASKALSVLTLQLDHEMANEVIEAILGSLTEDVLWDGSSRNLAAVNSLRWHGLTLTLGHLLYRRAIPTQQLPEILNALLLALTFEQRSATGSSVGTNVRDAANFGIWSVSRRYTTKELLAVETSSIRAAHNSNHNLSIPQLLAIELIESACLDPAGNIRRGSSAALQELIGRHPDTIVEGISLVQIVDFHAVGLRQRGITEVSISAAQSGSIYWNALFQALLGWRGIAAVDASSRSAAATATGLLGSSQTHDQVLNVVEKIRECLQNLSQRQVEERHGLVMALANIIATVHSQSTSLSHEDIGSNVIIHRSIEDLQALARVWSVFDVEISLSEKDFTSNMLRPELTASSTLMLLRSFSTLTSTLQKHSSCNPSVQSFSRAAELLNLCLIRSDESVLEEIPSTVRAFGALANVRAQDLAELWLSAITPTSTLSNKRTAGRVLAVGAIYGLVRDDLGGHTPILDCLTARCTSSVDIEARVTAIRSLMLVLDVFTWSQAASIAPDALAKIASSAYTTMNDYTINERGDVGSLVRSEALNLVEKAWRSGLLLSPSSDIKNANPDHQITAVEGIQSSVLRLSLEKLDKVRLRAAQCWTLHDGKTVNSTITDVSSVDYFSSLLALLDMSILQGLKRELIEGYSSSAGRGSESVVQASRLALYNFVDGLENSPNGESYSLLQFGNTISDILKDNLSDDRVLLPLLEVIAYLLDVQLLQRLLATSFKWRNFLSLIQKSHFKSNNVQKLVVVMDVYRGLADVDVIRKEVLTKVVCMLLHPFPTVSYNSVLFRC